MKPKFTIKKLADWRKLTKVMMPDLVIQKFKSVGLAGYLGEVTRLEAEVANIGNVRSGKCIIDNFHPFCYIYIKLRELVI